jgi:hypothetical protein
VPAPVRHMNRHARYESLHSKYAPSTHIIILFVKPAPTSIMSITVLAARLLPQVQKCPLPLESGMPLQVIAHAPIAPTLCPFSEDAVEQVSCRVVTVMTRA